MKMTLRSKAQDAATLPDGRYAGTITKAEQTTGTANNGRQWEAVRITFVPDGSNQEYEFLLFNPSDILTRLVEIRGLDDEFDTEELTGPIVIHTAIDGRGYSKIKRFAARKDLKQKPVEARPFSEMPAEERPFPPDQPAAPRRRAAAKPTPPPPPQADDEDEGDVGEDAPW